MSVDPYTDEGLYGQQPDCDCDGSDDHPHTCDMHTITWDAR